MCRQRVTRALVSALYLALQNPHPPMLPTSPFPIKNFQPGNTKTGSRDMLSQSQNPDEKHIEKHPHNDLRRGFRDDV